MLKILTALAATVAACALLLPTASLASTVISSSEDGLATARVGYGDLDLGKAAGADQLRGRIRIAANEVCGRPRPVELTDTQASRQCVGAAIASAQPAFAQAVSRARHGTVTVEPGASLLLTTPI